MKAVVAGAGPAGLSASIALARLGFDVQVLEKNKEWSQRVCGAFLSPESQYPLEWLGILPEARSGGSPCRRVTLHAGGRSGSFAIDKSGVPGLAIARKDLEASLLKKAESEGVRVIFGEKITERPACDLFVAAGGRFSELGGRKPPARRGWLAFQVAFRGASQAPGELSLHFFPRAYVGTLTFADGVTNVSGLLYKDLDEGSPGAWEKTLERMEEEDPSLKVMLKGSERVTPFKGVPHLPFGIRMKGWGEDIAVGDNAGVCDPYMGEGIARALDAGPLLYQSLSRTWTRKNWRAEAAGEYRKAWNALYRPRMILGGFLRNLLGSRRGLLAFHAAMTGVPFIRSWVLGFLHRETAWTVKR